MDYGAVENSPARPPKTFLLPFALVLFIASSAAPSEALEIGLGKSVPSQGEYSIMFQAAPELTAWLVLCYTAGDFMCFWSATVLISKFTD